MELPKLERVTASPPLSWALRLARHLWFVWSVLAFLFTGILALIAYLFIFNLMRGKRREMATFYVTKLWGRALLGFMGMRYSVEGAEKIDLNRNYIFVSNHQSALDIPFCMVSCPVAFSFLAKHEVDRIPIVGYLARNMHVYVNRQSEKSRKESAERMARHIQAGRSIHIYPEGTRNRSSALLKDFYDGAFRLAIETQTPIVVLSIGGSGRGMEGWGSLQACPAYVPCVWDEPIETKGMTLDDLDRLKMMVKERLLVRLQAWELAGTYY